jgi:hypothetical protein
LRRSTVMRRPARRFGARVALRDEHRVAGVKPRELRHLAAGRIEATDVTVGKTEEDDSRGGGDQGGSLVG